MNSEAPRVKASGESEVWNAIAAFERILEAIPNDHVALETLYEAYTQIGQTSRAIEYLVRLAESALEERDFGAAPGILTRFQELDDLADASAREATRKLQEMMKDAPQTPVAPTTHPDDSKRKSINITGELSLAWNLLQAGELSQDQYSSVVHDLSEGSARDTDSPVSVLHVLQGRGIGNLEKIMAFLARDTGTPVVVLSSFELLPEAVNLLTMNFMSTAGAIVFGRISDEAMVAVLNPYNTELREQVKQATGKPCHFYLVSANSYDQALSDIRKMAAAAAEQ